MIALEFIVEFGKSASVVLAGISFVSWHFQTPVTGIQLLLAAGIGVMFGATSALHFRYVSKSRGLN